MVSRASYCANPANGTSHRSRSAKESLSASTRLRLNLVSFVISTRNRSADGRRGGCGRDTFGRLALPPGAWPRLTLRVALSAVPKYRRYSSRERFQRSRTASGGAGVLLISGVWMEELYRQL